jgi:hypothetical protein
MRRENVLERPEGRGQSGGDQRGSLPDKPDEQEHRSDVEEEKRKVGAGGVVEDAQQRHQNEARRRQDARGLPEKEPVQAMREPVRKSRREIRAGEIHSAHVRYDGSRALSVARGASPAGVINGRRLRLERRGRNRTRPASPPDGCPGGPAMGPNTMLLLLTEWFRFFQARGNWKGESQRFPSNERAVPLSRKTRSPGS